MSFEIYQRYANEDMDEGRGKNVDLPGFFTSMEVAEAAAQGAGVYGSPAGIKTIPVFSDMTSFRQWEREQDPDWRIYKVLHEKFRGVRP